MLVEPVRQQIRNWPRPFELGVDKLALLPTGLGVEAQLVTPNGACIVFASDGLLNTMKRFSTSTKSSDLVHRCCVYSVREHHEQLFDRAAWKVHMQE